MRKALAGMIAGLFAFAATGCGIGQQRETTGGPEAGLVANVSAPLDPRLIIAVAFIAVAVGFTVGIFLAWRLLIPRRQAPPPSTPRS